MSAEVGRRAGLLETAVIVKGEERAGSSPEGPAEFDASTVVNNCLMRPLTLVVRSSSPLRTGGGSNGVTVTVNDWDALRLPSETETVTTAEPTAVRGASVNVRLPPVPPKPRALAGTTAALLEVAVTTRADAAVVESLMVKAIGADTAPTSTERVLRALTVGGVLGAGTETENVCVAVRAPSETVTVMREVPAAEGGRRVSVRLAPVPPSTREAWGRTARLLEVTRT